MFDSPSDLIRSDTSRIRDEIMKISSSAGRRAMAEFAANSPRFVDYVELFICALDALKTYNEVIIESCSGEDPDEVLKTDAELAGTELQQISEHLERYISNYKFMFRQ